MARTDARRPDGVLEEGEEGEAVRTLQLELARLGYAVGEPNGVFGPRTLSAVAAFQARERLGGEPGKYRTEWAPKLAEARPFDDAGVIAIAVYALWPSGNALERAVLDAFGQREIIITTNADEEKRDNAWLEEWEKNTAAGRDAALSAAGAAADRVLWRADDPWLRSKRAAKGR
jgi:peptidoglycan hydrolase-like protein with peptidoglycan-binding domain